MPSISATASASARREMVVVQPRMPCFKLGIRFGRDDVIKRFLESDRPGFYLRVLQEGDVAAGDPMVRIFEDPRRVSVVDIVRLYLGSEDRDLLARAAAVEALPFSWRGHFQQKLAQG
jgi:MOSC domain-containing protein YiiM